MGKVSGKVSGAELFVRVLAEVVGSRAVTIYAETEPKFSGGKSCPYKGKVKKRSTVNGLVNWIYENSVNNQRKREGKEADFEALPRSWGHRLRLSNRVLPFVARGVQSNIVGSLDELFNIPVENLYLELKVQQSLDTGYFIDGQQVLDPEQLLDIKSWLYRRQGESQRQELDNQIILRDYALTNIKGLVVNGRQLT